MKSHPHPVESPARGRQAWSFAAVAIVAAGCSAGIVGEEEPSVAAATALGETSDTAHVLDLAGLMGELLEGAGAAVPQPWVLRCDAEPEITHVEICGRRFPASAVFEWTDCAARMGPPGHGAHQGAGHGGRRGAGMGGMHGGGMRPPTEGGRHGPPPGGAPPEQRPSPRSSGKVEIATRVLAPEDGCNASTVLSLEQEASFTISRTGPRGTATSSGKTTSTWAHPLDAPASTRTTVLDSTRELADAEGNVLDTVRLTGTVSVTFDRATTPPARTFSGEVQLAHSDGTTRQLVLEDLLRVSPHVCFWPVAGTLRRTDPSGTASSLVFGPECGSAMLDGEAVTLHTSPHRRGRGGHHCHAGEEGAAGGEAPAGGSGPRPPTR